MSNARLAGGNTVQQAQKPARSKVTLPEFPLEQISFETYDRMRRDLDIARRQLAIEQEARAKALDENRRLLSEIASYKRNFGNPPMAAE